MNTTTARYFYKFLCRNNVLQKFMSNCSSQFELFNKKNKSIESSNLQILYFLGTVSLSTAFIWADTNEGHAFWNNIEDKWLKARWEYC